MPLIFEKELEQHTSVAVWAIEEDRQFFEDKLQLSKQEHVMLENMKSHRRKEWLTSRFLADRLCPAECRIKIVKDDMGKPRLRDASHNISISHSRDRVAVVRSDVAVGIDIQHEEKKITRIKHKFISTDEMRSIPDGQELQSYHLYWSAKECMYKAWGKRQLDFKKNMHLYPFICYQAELELSGEVRKDDIVQEYRIFSDKLDNYYLCYAIINDKKI